MSWINEWELAQDRYELSKMFLKIRRDQAGSTPFSRTLLRRPMRVLRSVHVEAKEVQFRVQAGSR